MAHVKALSLVSAGTVKSWHAKDITSLLSEKLLDEYSLLDASCPQCVAPTMTFSPKSEKPISKGTSPHLFMSSATVQPQPSSPILISSGSYEAPFAPVSDLPIGVSCHARVVTRDSDTMALEQCNSPQGKSMIIVAMEEDWKDLSTCIEVRLSDIPSSTPAMTSPYAREEQEDPTFDAMEKQCFFIERNETPLLEVYTSFNKPLSPKIQPDPSPAEEAERDEEPTFDKSEEHRDMAPEDAPLQPMDTEEELDSTISKKPLDPPGSPSLMASRFMCGETTQTITPSPETVPIKMPSDEPVLSLTKEDMLLNEPAEEKEGIEHRLCEYKRKESLLETAVRFAMLPPRPVKSDLLDPTEKEELDYKRAKSIQSEIASSVEPPVEAADDFVTDEIIGESSVRRDIATNVLGSKMFQGYSLVETQCLKCGMPLTEKKGQIDCVVCPVLAKEAEKKLKEQEEETILAEEKATIVCDETTQMITLSPETVPIIIPSDEPILSMTEGAMLLDDPVDKEEGIEHDLGQYGEYKSKMASLLETAMRFAMLPPKPVKSDLLDPMEKEELDYERAKSIQSEIASSVELPVEAADDFVTDEITKEYNVRRDIATKVLRSKMLQGYSLVETQCLKCGMPLTEKKGQIDCVVCPVLAKKAEKKLKEQEEEMILAEQKVTIDTEIVAKKKTDEKEGVAMAKADKEAAVAKAKVKEEDEAKATAKAEEAAAEEAAAEEAAAKAAANKKVTRMEAKEVVMQAATEEKAAAKENIEEEGVAAKAKAEKEAADLSVEELELMFAFTDEDAFCMEEEARLAEEERLLAHSQNNLGFCYSSGVRASRDLERGAGLFQLAAKQGHTTMSNTFEVRLERMVYADDAEEYAIAKSSFYDYEFEEGEEKFVAQVNNCIPALLRRMHDDLLDNKRLQQGCTRVLSDLHERCFPVIQAILSFVQECPDNPSVARLGFGLIKNGLVDGVEHVDDDFFSVVINSMVRHETDPLVQEYALACMEEYMKTEDRRAKVRDSHAPRVFLKVMRNHPNNSDLQAAACNALGCLDKAILTEEWPPGTILQAMNSHAHCVKVQMSACTLLRNILKDVKDEEVETTLRPVSGQLYVQAILNAMENHFDNKEVQSTGLCILKALIAVIF